MPYAIGSANRNFLPGRPTTDTPRRLGHRRQDRRDVEHDARPDLQHRLRAGRGGRAADQPDAVQPAVSREAAVLPREPRAVRRRQERRGRPVLQPPHRHRRQRRVRAHSRRRAADRQGRRHQRRPAEHADRARRPDARRTTSRRCGSARICANRSSVGGIFVNRAATGETGGIDSWNRTFGLDGRLGIGEAVTVSGFAARTETPGLAGREHAYSSAFEYRSRAYELERRATRKSATTSIPEVGFLERPDGYRQCDRRLLSERADGRTRQRRASANGGRTSATKSFWGFDGFQETATLHIDSAWDFENGIFISPALNVQYEGLREPFEVYPGVVVPAGSYRQSDGVRDGATPIDRKWISGSINWQRRRVPVRQPGELRAAADDSPRRHASRRRCGGRATTSICRRAPS